MKNQIKLSPKAKAIIMMGMAAALSAESQSPVADTVKALDTPMTEEEKNKARGLKYFEMPDGSRVPAINHKNALKKWTKKN